MSKKCPKCESKDIHITYYPAPTDNMATCYGCGYADLAERFPEQTVFDRITTSPEVLAEKLVYRTIEIAVNRVIYSCWKSTITEEAYRTKAEAIAATVAKLKEVAE